MSSSPPEPALGLDAAILCDAATVREGLLHILGGGITRIWRRELPAPMGLTLALLVRVPQDLARVPHEIRVELRDGEGVQVALSVTSFLLPPGIPVEPGESLKTAIPVSLQAVPLGHFGRHTATIQLDGIVARTEEFWLLHEDERRLPPINAV